MGRKISPSCARFIEQSIAACARGDVNWRWSFRMDWPGDAANEAREILRTADTAHEAQVQLMELLWSKEVYR